MKIPFNKPHLTNNELRYIKDAHSLGALSGDGPYTKACHQWLKENFGFPCLLTHSCTAALEMMALLTKLQPGDEVIMPSYTFVSTANAFALRGAIPVFVDVRPDTQNLDESKIESAITSKTKAIVPVHYAGVSCEMDTIMEIAKKHKLYVLEDAAQAFSSKYKGKFLGGIGNLGAYSFHETKNIISGEGGALMINDPSFSLDAEIIREKGTNRSQFFRGQVDKYTWVSLGSSYLPGEIIAAFLKAQLESADRITKRRLYLWDRYHQGLHSLQARNLLRLPIVPEECTHNAHMYYVLTNDLETRTALIGYLKEKNMMSVFHYVPLHSSPAGKRYARFVGDMTNTDVAGERLLRLPLYFDLSESEQDKILQALEDFFKE